MHLRGFHVSTHEHECECRAHVCVIRLCGSHVSTHVSVAHACAHAGTFPHTWPSTHAHACAPVQQPRDPHTWPSTHAHACAPVQQPRDPPLQSRCCTPTPLLRGPQGRRHVPPRALASNPCAHANANTNARWPDKEAWARLLAQPQSVWRRALRSGPLPMHRPAKVWKGCLDAHLSHKGTTGGGLELHRNRGVGHVQCTGREWARVVCIGRRECIACTAA